MQPTPPAGPLPTPVPAEDESIVRNLFPQLERMATVGGSEALVAFTSEVLAAAERYLAKVQDPAAAPAPTVGSPTVRANECVLNGVLRALTVPGLSVSERARLTDLGRAAARNAGMDHLTFSGAAA